MRWAALLLPLVAWSGTAPEGVPAFEWWRRSVRRSLTVLGVVTVLAVAVATLGR
ncbi:MAG: hypothetical protein QOE35_2937 [Actinomycetota bacterium]|jgi:hypothetical protein